MTENTYVSENLNVLEGPLKVCSCKPLTGWFRDGLCKSSVDDFGNHSVCCIMNDSFLGYSKAQGNDLTTPNPYYNFPGLTEGDGWCLCASRWLQAYDDGVAPPVLLEATDKRALSVIPLALLKEKSAANTNS